MKKKFVCPICGYVHEGTEAPERCPQCKQIVQSICTNTKNCLFAFFHALKILING